MINQDIKNSRGDQGEVAAKREGGLAPLCTRPEEGEEEGRGGRGEEQGRRRPFAGSGWPRGRERHGCEERGREEEKRKKKWELIGLLLLQV